MSTPESTEQTDELDTGHPVNRLEEIQKQARIVADDVDDASASRYVQRAAACAESALVVLQGPEILDGDNNE